MSHPIEEAMIQRGMLISASSHVRTCLALLRSAASCLVGDWKSAADLQAVNESIVKLDGMAERLDSRTLEWTEIIDGTKRSGC